MENKIHKKNLTDNEVNAKKLINEKNSIKCNTNDINF